MWVTNIGLGIEGKAWPPTLTRIRARILAYTLFRSALAIQAVLVAVTTAATQTANMLVREQAQLQTNLLLWATERLTWPSF